MGNIVDNYFANIFASSNPHSFEESLATVERKITPAMNQLLCAPYSAEEVRQALFQMHPSKSPGPDGMSCLFFQKYWHIINEDVVGAVLSVLHSGHVLRKINFTHVVLIPKINDPRSVSDFRPISLCNVIYKIISKVLANRLKGLLDFVVSESQSAFVPGRLITDNVAVAFELLHGLKSKRNGKKGQMAVKLDMSKAYNRVEWIFLERLMAKLGFEGHWVALVMACIKTVSYSIILNGEPHGLINPSRGIRQGDPISPYLFLLCAEGLSSLIQQAALNKTIHGVSVCRGGPKISHLLFADDSLIFCEASLLECEKLGLLLELYEAASGQKINRQKTAIFFSKNTEDSVRADILLFWGASNTAHFEKYLGLPAVVGRNKTQAFKGIRDRVVKRLEGWKERLLSKAGKEVLIKAVIQALPTYSMSCFCFRISGVLILTLWQPNTGGAVEVLLGKFIGLNGVSYANQRKMAGWVFGIGEPSISLCWQSKDGVSSQTPILFSTKLLRLSIFLPEPFCKPRWGQTHHSSGEVFLRHVRSCEMG